MHAVKVRLCESILNLCGLCLLLIAFVIGAGVLMHLFGVSQLIAFETPHWLVGGAITFNSLMGLQVLLFTVAIMMAIAPVMLLDRHVRVDVFHSRLSTRYRHAPSGITLFLAVLVYLLVKRTWLLMSGSSDHA